MNWRKSKYSGQGGGNCVEAGNGNAVVAVRDTKQARMPSRDTLTFKPADWQAFTRRLKAQ